MPFFLAFSTISATFSDPGWSKRESPIYGIVYDDQYYGINKMTQTTNRDLLKGFLESERHTASNNQRVDLAIL